MKGLGMDEIFECVDKLTTILVNSDVYQNYLLAKKNLDTGDMDLLREFKNLHFKFVNSKQNNFDTEKIISNLYSKLILKPQTRSFLQNELLLTECIKKIYTKFSEALEIETFC